MYLNHVQQLTFSLDCVMALICMLYDIFLKYVQASNGQVVMAYPNIVRPVGADSSATQHPQVFFIKYISAKNQVSTKILANPIF